MRLGWLIVFAAACGVAPSRELVVVAHQDDDLLFMQPDLFGLVASHAPLTVVYVTAGDDGEGLVRARARQHAAMEAYAAVAQVPGACDGERCQIGDVDLVFLGYPDGGLAGEAPSSMLRLWEGSIASAQTIADVPVTYDRDGLVGAVAAIIRDARPHTIRTLDVSGTHGDDHSDHLLVGALTQLALAQSTSDAQLIAYRGYNVNYDPPNIDERAYADASLFMRSYLACMTTCGACGTTPCETIDDARYVGFLHRSYPIAMQRGAGMLCSGARCIPDVLLGDDGLVHVEGRCLELAADQRIVRGACRHDAHHHFVLDGEGHLWAGIAAPAAANMLYDHALCVVPDGGLHAELCGASRVAVWRLD